MSTPPLEQRRPVRLAAPFVLVTGGKGGVGKTTVAARLGVELARAGHRALLVDLDLGLANLDLALGVDPCATLEDVLAGRAALRDSITPGPDGVHLVAGASGDESLGRLPAEGRTALLQELASLSRDYDIVVGDSAAGIGPDVMDFARAADRVLVVTTPEVAALTDAYGLIKALDQFGRRTDRDIPTPELVVNLASGVEEGQAVALKLRAVCERFLSRSPRQAGWIPRSSGLGGSIARRPGTRQGLEDLCLRRLAERLGRLCGAPLRAAGAT